MRQALTAVLLSLATLASALVVAPPRPAQACACCVSTGTRGIGSHPLSSFELDEIGRLVGGWAKAQPKHFGDGGIFDQIYQPRSTN